MPGTMKGSNRSGSNSPKRGMPKKLLREVLELERVKTKDGSFRYTIKPVEDTLTFDKGFYVFVRAVQLLKSHNDGVVLVGLGGASGSGKTAFSEKIKSFLPGVVVISMDMYNDGSKVIDQNFDDPRLTDYECLLSNLADLKAGRPTQVPIYDFKHSRRAGYQQVDVPGSRVVILEGIYALSDRIRHMLDLRVSIMGGVHFDLVKRVMRDITRAGQGPEAIVEQVTSTVYPMFKAFIEPDLQTAQLRIHNDFNPFSGFMHPTYILKSSQVPELQLIRDQLQLLGEVGEVKDRDLADIYLLPPGEDPETCQSWLRMRNKEGRYSLMFEEWVVEEPFIISPRITFEVNVKILGGLMALGYEIGTIMRRTSHIFTVKSADITLKVDDVENLGNFIQLLGRDRQRVAELGHALGLDGTYIARSYIEQVQLGKLTSDFPAVTAEMRDRLTTADSSSQALFEILNASPPARMPRRRPEAKSGPDSLSCSAPPEAPLYSMLTISGSRGPSPPTYANGSSTQQQQSSFTSSRGRGGSSSNLAQQMAGTATPNHNHTRPPSGLLYQQLQQAATPIRASSPAPAARTQSGFSPAPGASLLSNSLSREPPYTPSAPRASSVLPPLQAPGGPHGLRSSSTGDLAGALGSGHGLVDAGLLGLSVAVEQIEGQLHSMTTCLAQYSGMGSQLQALATQQQATQQAVQQLSEATAALAANLQAALAVAAPGPQPAGHSKHGGRGSLAPAASAGSLAGGGASLVEQLWVPAGVALLAGCVASGLVLLLGRAGSSQHG